MNYSIGEIIGRYIELRDAKAALAKKHEAEMAPINEAMDALSNYLQHQMNTLGVDSLKAEGIGIAYKSTTASVTLKDAAAFKAFLFRPVVEHILGYFHNAGYPLRDVDHEAVQRIVCDMPVWQAADLRAGKKGIQELEEAGTKVPGVSSVSMSTVNVRRA